MKTTQVATFNARSDAEPVVQKLQDAGIAAVIHDESGVGRFMYAAEQFAGVRVEVPAADYEEARRLLQLWDTPEGIMHAALHCPECGSSRIEYPQHTRKFFLPNLIGLLTAAHVIDKKFYCMDCQNTWLPPTYKPPPPRAHEAPDYFISDVEGGIREGEDRRKDKAEKAAKH